MDKKLKTAVKEYQCRGCAGGPALTCYKKYEFGDGCSEHVAGTTILPLPGKVWPGMPKGFNRLGPLGFSDNSTKIIIYENFETANRFYDKWNVPVWKYFDSKTGNTFIRGMHPRNNMPFVHVYLENVLDKIECFEVSQEMVEFMD